MEDLRISKLELIQDILNMTDLKRINRIRQQIQEDTAEEDTIVGNRQGTPLTLAQLRIDLEESLNTDTISQEELEKLSEEW